MFAKECLKLFITTAHVRLEDYEDNKKKVSAGTSQTYAENGAATWRTQRTQYSSIVYMMWSRIQKL